MNLSSTTPESNYSPSSNRAEYNWTAALLSLVIFLSLFGNGLVILAFYRFHALRTATNYFVVSLAVADILVASLSVPCWMYIQLSAMAKIPKDVYFSTVLYYSWQFVDILCSTASIVNLCMISVDRYLAINSPLSYHRRMTAGRAKVSIAFAWLFAFFCAAVSIVTVVKSLMPSAGRAYGIFISFTAFFIPLFILIALYGKICCLAFRQIRLIASANPCVHGVQKEHNATFRRELKVTKTLGVVVGAFVLCWGPFFTVVLFYAVCPQCPPYQDWVAASKWLHYTSSILNPLIYMLFTRTFRSAFRKLLVQGICCRKPPHGRTRFSLSVFKSATVHPSEMHPRKTGCADPSEIGQRNNGSETPQGKTGCLEPNEMTGSVEPRNMLHLSVPLQVLH